MSKFFDTRWSRKYNAVEYYIMKNQKRQKIENYQVIQYYQRMAQELYGIQCLDDRCCKRRALAHFADSCITFQMMYFLTLFMLVYQKLFH